MAGCSTPAVQALRAQRARNGLCRDCGGPVGDSGKKACVNCLISRSAARKKSRLAHGQRTVRLGSRRSPFRSQLTLAQVAADWHFPLEWPAVREWVKSNIALWEESGDGMLWQHLSLDVVDWQVDWSPQSAYYDRQGSRVSLEDYVIDWLDFYQARAENFNLL